MPSLVDTLWDSAGAPLNRELFGVAVVYWRGNDSVPLTAIPSVIDNVTYDADGGALTTAATLRQYVIESSDLVLSGVTIEPRRHDRIVETIGGREVVHEVAPIDNKPVADLQLGGSRWLVRTRQVT